MTASPPDLDVAASLEVETPTDLVSARRAAGAVRGFLARHGLDPEQLFAWELCVTEAAKNAVQYALADQKNLPIRVEVTVRRDFVQVRVIDHTPGFDLAQWPSCLPLNENESGRGLFLMRVYMDKVKYAAGRGANTLVLEKTRLPSEATRSTR